MTRPGLRVRFFGAWIFAAALSLIAVGLGAAQARATPTKPAGRGCVNARTPATRSSIRAMRAAVVCLVNRQRERHGLPGLHWSAALDRSAQAWTNTMVASDRFSHGSDPGARISAAGLAWSLEGENVASGYARPSDVVNAWMSSASHCQNILDPSFTDIGVGVNRHPVRGSATRPGTWTQDFALPRGDRARSGNWGPANACPY